MKVTPCNVGAFVWGAPTSPRALVRHADLFAAYANGDMLERDEVREAYLSHFVFGPALQAHYDANRQSVAGFVGPCWCRWLVLDIDRADLADALSDVLRLMSFLYQRYPETIGEVPVYFSGGKGFHVLIELAHNPAPAVGFHRVARTFAESIASRAGVRIDPGIYDSAHIIRLPNTRHPRTGLYKRRIDADAIFDIDIEGIRRHAAHPAGDGIPTLRTVPENLPADWQEAEAATARATVVHNERQRQLASVADSRAPRYFVEFLRFGVPEGERHRTLFRCAAWLTEQGAPPSLAKALLTEPGLDVGLTPKDVERQIDCGIKHACRQRLRPADPCPDATADPDAFERWAIEHEADPLPPGALDFAFGLLAPGLAEGEGGPT